MMKRVIAYLFCMMLSVGLLESQAAPMSQRDPEIRAAVESYVQQKTGQLGYLVRIKKMTMSGPTTLPEGPVDFEVVAPQQWEGWGAASIAVIARQGNRIVRNIPIRVEVEALADMVVPVHQIDYGRVITTDDVVVKKMDIAAVNGRFVSKTADAVGRKARTTFRANSPIKPELLEKVPLISSGQMVTVLAETGNIRITVTGKARSSGAEGDTIRVQNLDSLKEFPARIIDAKTVAIAF